MNFFELVLKQMRQRALSSWLTLLSVTLAVALAVALLVVQREGGRLFGQTEFGYDALVGAKGSRLQLVMNMVYQLDQPPGTVGWDVVESLRPGGRFAAGVRWSVPVATADTVEGHPVLATLPAILGYEDDGQTRLPDGRHFEYRVGREPELAEGRAFHARRFEAVLGSRTATNTGFAVGDAFTVYHGTPGEAGGHEHSEEFEVVGILRPTGTALDGTALLPIAASLAIDSHGSALESIGRLLEQGVDPSEFRVDLSDVTAAGGREFEYYVLDADGMIHLKIPQRLWRVSGIFVASRSGFRAQQMLWQVNNSPDAMAVSPAVEMRQFFDRFLRPSVLMMMAVTGLVTVVAAVSILVSIYNSVSARRREIAVLRSLGATRGRVLSLVCTEAALLGAAGAVAGWVAGHAVAHGASLWLQGRLGEGFDALSTGPVEWAYLIGVVVVAGLAGLVPALKAYGTPVAQNLVE